MRILLLLALAALPGAALPQSPGASGPTTGELPAALAPAPDVVLSARLAAPEKVTFEEAVKRAIAFNTSALIAAQEIVRAEGLMGRPVPPPSRSSCSAAPGPSSTTTAS